MGLYLGGTKYNIVLDGNVFCLNIPSPLPIINGSILLSSDEYILQDADGLCLIPQEHFILHEEQLLSSEGYILKDKNYLCLTVEKGG